MRGIYVANCPGKNTAAVAELAIGLLVAADRRLVDATLAMRQGAWQKKEFGKARGLAGRTLGILGFGAIGQAVTARAAGLEMKVVAWSRSLTPEIAEAQGIGYAASPEALAAACDAVSVHLALTPETKHLVGPRFLEAMRPGAILINTSARSAGRYGGPGAAIANRNLRVGLDVFENEPAGGEAAWSDKELAALVTCTPHVGASTDQAAEAVAAEVVRIIELFVKTGRPAGTVNLCAHSPAKHRLVVRHLNRVGVLAHVLDSLARRGSMSKRSTIRSLPGPRPPAARCCWTSRPRSPCWTAYATTKTSCT